MAPKRLIPEEKAEIGRKEAEQKAEKRAQAEEDAKNKAAADKKAEAEEKIRTEQVREAEKVLRTTLPPQAPEKPNVLFKDGLFSSRRPSPGRPSPFASVPPSNATTPLPSAPATPR